MWIKLQIFGSFLFNIFPFWRAMRVFKVPGGPAYPFTCLIPYLEDQSLSSKECCIKLYQKDISATRRISYLTYLSREEGKHGMQKLFEICLQTQHLSHQFQVFED